MNRTMGYPRDIAMTVQNPKTFYSPVLNCRFYWDKENTGEIFTTAEQAAIACSCSVEDILRSITYKPYLITINGQTLVFITFMQLTDFLHKFRPSVLAECLLIAVTQTKV
jgi:hypothetical protein